MAGKKEPAKATAAADAAAPAPAAKKSSKYLKLLIILITLGSAGGGAAYWYLGQSKNHKTGEVKAPPTKPPVYVPLEVFTVNLQVEEHPQFLQTGLSLRVADAAVVDSLKVHMPEVRDRILLLLSSRKPSELLTVDGKRKLSSDIVDAVNAILSPAAPAAKAAAQTKPPAKAPDEKPAEETTAAAEGEEKPESETAAAASPAPAPTPQLPILSVLFTSFIVQ